MYIEYSIFSTMAYGGHVVVFAQITELKDQSNGNLSKINWIFSVKSK